MKPTLVVMAAGMGSRYGGLKQIDPIGKNGEVIIDYSIYDAVKSGFENITFVIKKEIEEDFKSTVGKRLSSIANISYVYQDIANLPKGFAVPDGRVKPWGTGHAVLSCLGTVEGNFGVINADDYYGQTAFKKLYDFLKDAKDGEFYDYAMVGYIIENTLTDYGHVARGVCEVDANGYLSYIKERTRIEKFGEETKYTEDEGATYVTIPKGSVVSMNFWGFTPSILKELNEGFADFLQENLPKNPLKCEYFLPDVVGRMLNKKAKVKVLKSEEKWYGVTYKEDKANVVKAIGDMVSAGKYPERLWS